MSHDKVITVLGATGTQGGAVARALLAGGEFGVRAVTRNAASAKARALAGFDAQVVAGVASDDIGRVLQQPSETIGATVDHAEFDGAPQVGQ
nr:hypothetical protein GCM10020063_044080 [Dactylosporangium thailandense]